MSRRTAIWLLAALLGIVVTAAITWATSQLTSQRIGLASEPLSAGSGLAPGAEANPAVTRTTTRRAGRAHSTATATVTTTATYPAVPPHAPSPSEPVPSAAQSPPREASEPSTSRSRSRDDGAEGGGSRARDD